ncbi:MAG: bifunctional GNAT family N-acetyltransferase/nucleoside triphosphate pyrophosphohydrolase family protein [bacterium]|nr:bifunctional GNAT family N-acetyltransferase/nucleoside triphosphate pyrophosphohydrolase family protein [bacterium]
MELTDGEITLSPATEADIAVITAACQDPAISRFTTVPSPYTEEHAREFVTRYAPQQWKNGGASWAIRRGSEFLGMVDLMVEAGRTEPPWQAEIGYWVAPEARGTGALAHAIPLLLDFGFGTMNLRRINWFADVDNWPSWKAVWRHGFVREGIRRAYDLRETGEARDMWQASLLATDPRTPATEWDGPTTTAAGTPAPAIPSSRDPEALVRQFHATYRLPVLTSPANVDIERVHMRMGLIAEEFAELVGAVYGEAAEQTVLDAVSQAVAGDDHTRDTIETADALADLIYVIYGMALETGIPLDAVLHQVQRSNMSKLGADGQPIYREDGKVLKGPGFFNPDIAAVLERTRLAP